MCSALLVVDDEHSLRQFLEQGLANAGHDVALASDGSQAIGLLERSAFTPDALITDLKLGDGPNGWQVARRARELDPGVPVIYMTGGRGQEWRPAWAPDGVMLLKPFTLQQMLIVAEALLAGRR